ncbi:hypothetical protein N0V90_003544 [Kalmusia sp. IMI 367209]|nr:hypothetical protein N0V90_003544 [Kalmusia sp. IMI 367209]
MPTAIASAPKKRKRASSPEPPPIRMFTLNQTLDKKGSPKRLLIGIIQNREDMMPLFAYLKTPFWVMYTFGNGKRRTSSALATDLSVSLIAPFAYIGAEQHSSLFPELEALIL